MELTIATKEKNPFLDRMNITGTITFDAGTPTNKEVLAAIAKEVGVDNTLVVLRRIHTQFGAKKAQVEAVAYKSAEAKKKAEKTTKHLRKAMEEQKKVEVTATTQEAEA